MHDKKNFNNWSRHKLCFDVVANCVNLVRSRITIKMYDELANLIHPYDSYMQPIRILASNRTLRMLRRQL